MKRPDVPKAPDSFTVTKSSFLKSRNRAVLHLPMVSTPGQDLIVNLAVTSSEKRGDIIVIEEATNMKTGVPVRAKLDLAHNGAGQITYPRVSLP